jgi:hypothetical protein
LEEIDTTHERKLKKRILNMAEIKRKHSTKPPYGSKGITDNQYEEVGTAS